MSWVRAASWWATYSFISIDQSYCVSRSPTECLCCLRRAGCKVNYLPFETKNSHASNIYIYICSDFEVSVSVAWEKIKGDNDAGRQEGGELWLQEGSAKAAAAKAAAAAAASTPELVSPLPSVVASQVEFIKHTLRAQNAHVRSLPFTFYSCLRIQLVLCNRCSGCRVTATERGSSAITACSAPNCVFIVYR